MVYALGHPDFETFCRDFEYTITKYKWTWTGKKTWKETFKGFWKSEGRTGFQVYNHLLTGQEVLPEGNPEDNEADVYLKIDRRYKKGVIGYTYPSTKWQWIYQWVLNDWGAEDVAGNLAHEWCHKMSYKHEKERTARRPYSVPYAIGYYVRDFIKRKKI